MDGDSESTMERKAWRAVTIGYKLRFSELSDNYNCITDRALLLQRQLVNAGFRPTDYWGSKMPEDDLYFGYTESKTSLSVNQWPVGDAPQFVFGISLLAKEKRLLHELVDDMNERLRNTNYEGMLYTVDENEIIEKKAPRLRGKSARTWMDWGRLNLPAIDGNFVHTTGWICHYDNSEGKRLFSFRVGESEITKNKIQFKFHLTTDEEASLLDSPPANTIIRAATDLFRKVCVDNAAAHGWSDDWGEFDVQCQSTLKAEKKAVCDVSWLMIPDEGEAIITGGEEE